MFSYLVEEKVYGPVDRLARAVDLDMVRQSIYDALRYISTEFRREGTQKAQAKQIEIPSEEEIHEFLETIEKKGLGIARKVAIKALTKGLKESRQQPQQKQ